MARAYAPGVGSDDGASDAPCWDLLSEYLSLYETRYSRCGLPAHCLRSCPRPSICSLMACRHSAMDDCL